MTSSSISSSGWLAKNKTSSIVWIWTTTFDSQFHKFNNSTLSPPLGILLKFSGRDLTVVPLAEIRKEYDAQCQLQFSTSGIAFVMPQDEDEAERNANDMNKRVGRLVLSLHSNRLTELPSAICEMKFLEEILVYNNQVHLFLLLLLFMFPFVWPFVGFVFCVLFCSCFNSSIFHIYIITFI